LNMKKSPENSDVRRGPHSHRRRTTQRSSSGALIAGLSMVPVYVTEVEAAGSCAAATRPGVIVGKWKWERGSGPGVPEPEWGDCQGSWGVGGQCDSLTTTPVRLPYGYPGKHVFIAEVNYKLIAVPFFNIPGLNKESLHAWAIF